LWSRGGSDVFGLRPLPALFGRWFDDLLVLADRLPLECDLRMPRLELAQDRRFERIAADTNAARGPEHIKDARSLPVPVAIPVHQVRGLVPTSIANDPQERHRGLPPLL